MGGGLPHFRTSHAPKFRPPLLPHALEFSAQVWRGAKTWRAIIEGGARFECERFSEFHRPPPCRK